MTSPEDDDDKLLRNADPAVERAIHVATRTGLPSASLALYARWWQLETWLRDLCYVELRALAGLNWKDLVRAGFGRQEQDAAYKHMMTADTENPLAYLDYSQLIEVIDRHWSYFEYALLTQTVWNGRQEELKRIRHRIGHLRQPHADDLNRLDQTLRDLERGTFIAFASYNRRTTPIVEDHSDPVTIGWIKGEHPTAKRLLLHAQEQYGTNLRLSVSRRPWAPWQNDFAGKPGFLWHCDFIMRERSIDARRFWNDDQLAATRPYLLHFLAYDPFHIAFTFAAVDDTTTISDVIGHTFDAVLGASRPSYGMSEDWSSWSRRAQSVDFRLQNGSGWAIVDDQTLPISNFGSGGGVESAPRW